MSKIELYYKLVITNIISQHLTSQRLDLHNELYTKADDPVILKRRFRMISQLAEYESQIYKKIYNFQSNNIEDYIVATRLILSEIQNVVDKSG